MYKYDVQFIAMDFETTGLDPDSHGPISLGLANDEHEIYLTCHPGSRGKFEVDAKALEVNGFDFEDVIHHPATVMQDLRLYKMLQETYSKDMPFEAVGLNVGNFDMQFLRRFFPNTYKLFSHRPFDMTTMFRTMCIPNGEDWKEIRDIATLNALDALNLNEEDLHDAFNDARVAWFLFKEYMY